MSLAIKEEECTICLEVITFSSTIGTIKNCHHYYHEDCILQWSSHSNSCPTCRKLFYKIDVSRHDEPNKIRKLISIRDKLLPNDAIDQIPQEYIIPTNYPSTDRENSHSTLDQITEHYSSNNKLCSICSSSDYRSSLSRNLIYCNNCPSAFHLNCLGINAYEEFDDLTWCCPMCDSLQDLSAMPTYQSGVSNRSRSSRGAGNIRPRANRIRTSRTTTTLLNSHITDAIFRNASVPINVVPRVDNLNVTLERTSRENSRRRPGLIIHNENGELDDDFLYDTSNLEEETNIGAENKRMYSPPIINGGVILRKELKEKQKLSKEEAQSWDVFDEARKCKVDSESSNVVKSVAQKIEEPRARRRRKKLSDLPHPNPNPELIEGTSANLQNVSEKKQEKTRISSLISQVRSQQKGCKYERKVITGHGSPTTPEISTGISLNPTESISGDSGALSDIETKSQRKKACIDKPTSMELSLEQKVEIQKHIRNNLRPLYRPGESNPSRSPTIRSEEIYIEINKSASRKIYAHILSLITSGRDQLECVEYFNDDETKLKSIVEKFVQDELRYYKW